jgi:hypothetical protein
MIRADADRFVPVTRQSRGMSDWLCRTVEEELWLEPQRMQEISRPSGAK